MLEEMNRDELLDRISEALELAGSVLKNLAAADFEARYKKGGDPVTEADEAIDRVLRETLLRDGEGWLSEETKDDGRRLSCDRVWIVDPIDGTKEFISGIPEYAISVGFVHRGCAIAGGVCNPATEETFLGAVGLGVTCNGVPVLSSERASLDGARVVASRSEIRRGEWAQHDDAVFRVDGVGSVAYRLALVAAGLAEATWTMESRNEWDLAAGVALAQASGCLVYSENGRPIVFNRPNVRVDGLFVHPRALKGSIEQTLGITAVAAEPGDPDRP